MAAMVRLNPSEGIAGCQVTGQAVKTLLHTPAGAQGKHLPAAWPSVINRSYPVRVRASGSLWWL